MRPEGLIYQTSFISREEEESLIAVLESFEYKEVRMHGVVARRRVVHFGFDYDYSGWKIFPTDPLPESLEPIVARAASAAKVERSALEQFLIARYPPDAAIGWHRDAPMFGTPVIGISLGSSCTMRFRRKAGAGWETHNHLLEQRSLYVLDGPSRSQWQHSIPRTPELRYSFTMRTLKKRPQTQAADSE